MWLLPVKATAGSPNRPARRGSTLTDVQFQNVVREAIGKSRFTANTDVEKYRGHLWGVKIMEVRLRRKKDYCGQHPGPCVALFPKKHIRAAYLEGLDWVGFNALLNDTFDKLNEHCVIFSYNREMIGGNQYFIRKDGKRRVGYPFEYVGRFAGWTEGGDNDFEDHCGKPPPPLRWNVADSGTPGYPCYTLEEEEKYRAEEECLHA